MDMIKCPYCQQEIPAGSKFCPECGKNLRDIPPAPVPSPVTPDNDTTPPPVKVQPVNDSTPSANNNAVPYMGTQPTGKKGLIAFVIIGVIVIIGVFLASHWSAISLFGCKHENTEVLASKTATCTAAGLTEGLKCADCGKVLKEQERIDPLGHTTETGICARCGENFGNWEKRFYVDEFDSPTDEAYIRNKNYIVGKFSNSATTDSLLKVTILADERDICVKLFEYGNNLVKNSSSRHGVDYDVTIKTPSGEKIRLDGYMGTGSDIFAFSPNKMTAKSAFFAVIVFLGPNCVTANLHVFAVTRGLNLARPQEIQLTQGHQHRKSQSRGFIAVLRH